MWYIKLHYNQVIFFERFSRVRIQQQKQSDTDVKMLFFYIGGLKTSKFDENSKFLMKPIPFHIFYFFKSLFDITFILPNNHLNLIFIIWIFICHNFYIPKLLFLIISTWPNYHVTEKLFYLNQIRPKNNSKGF